MQQHTCQSRSSRHSSQSFAKSAAHRTKRTEWEFGVSRQFRVRSPHPRLRPNRQRLVDNAETILSLFTWTPSRQINGGLKKREEGTGANKMFLQWRGSVSSLSSGFNSYICHGDRSQLVGLNISLRSIVKASYARHCRNTDVVGQPLWTN
jgi:hypothetical protein